MPPKILVADDSVTIQRVIQLALAGEDVEVVTVANGQRATEQIEIERPDLIFADVTTPEQSGYELAAFVKATPHLAHIPIVLLTEAFDSFDEARAREIGCEAVLSKPFERDAVLDHVRRLLGARSRSIRATAPDERQDKSARGSDQLRSDLERDVARTSKPAGMVHPQGPPYGPSSAEETLDDYFDRLDESLEELAAEQQKAHKQADQQASPRSESKQAAGDSNIDEALIQEVTRRVLDRLAHRLVREVVTDVVLGVAERLVREEIERIKRSSGE